MVTLRAWTQVGLDRSSLVNMIGLQKLSGIVNERIWQTITKMEGQNGQRP